MSNRTKTHLLWGLALASLGVMAAPSGCGGSNTGYGAFANADGGNSTFDATSGSSSGGSSSGGSSNGSSGDDGSTCVSSCNADSDCQGSCGAPSGGGIQCCDQSSHTCFPDMSGTCPSAMDSGATE